MISGHLCVISPRTWRMRRAQCITVWTLVSIGMLGLVTVAQGQSEISRQMMTEIWMSGEDLAVTRRIPQDRRVAQRSYDEVARSMVIIAELRYQDRDEETAEWLHQWALELTGGRIGDKHLAAPRDQQSQEFAVQSMTQSEMLGDEGIMPLLPDVDPYGFAIEWPISAFTDEPTRHETQPIADESELLSDRWRPDDREELASHQGTDDEQAADGVATHEETRPEAYESGVAAAHADSFARSSRLSNLVVDPRENSMDNARRQVASVPRNMQQDFARQLHYAAPAVPTENPMTLALTCFAAGVVCCFVLHTLLLLTPVRLKVCRPNASPSGTSDKSLVPVTPTGRQSEPVRAEGFSSRPQTQTPKLSQQQDEVSSMVEEFYNSNVELFERFAVSAN